MTSLRLCAVIAILLLSLVAAPAAQADSIIYTVSTSTTTAYQTIQAAIDAAATELANNPLNTYTVVVEPGTWAGGISLRSNIPVHGRETARTIIQGTGVLVTASGVSNTSISKFTFSSGATGVLLTGNATNISVTTMFSCRTPRESRSRTSRRRPTPS